MPSERLTIQELDAVRTMRRATMAAIAHRSGLSLTSVWRVLSGRSYDLRKIVRICKALRVSPRRLDFEALLGDPKQARDGHKETAANAERR
jgi:transcriptional regulator with XRE-family HTH domain